MWCEINFAIIWVLKIAIFANLETLNFEFLANLVPEKCSNLLESKFRTSKIAKNDNFWLFEVAKIWFRAKSEWQYT